ISQYDQDIACGQLKSDRNPSKNRTQSSRLRQRSANFSSLLGHFFRMSLSQNRCTLLRDMLWLFETVDKSGMPKGGC
ncbi:hypothetical protein ACCS65_18820, partial [Rhizobium ruizarguesonis]